MPTDSQQRQAAVQASEIAVVAALFLFACLDFSLVSGGEHSAASRTVAVIVFTLLTACYLGLSFEPVQQRLQRAVSRGIYRRAAGPALLLAAIALNAVVSRAPLLSEVVPYAVYLFLPVGLLTEKHDPATQRPIRQLAVAVLLWLPLTFGLPKLRLDGTYDATHLVGVVAGLYFFLVLEPLEGIGYTFRLRRRDWSSAATAFAAFVAVAAPIGLLTGFLAWSPRPTADNLVMSPLHIYLAIAMPEELLFRGIIQNVCVRWIGMRRGLIVSAFVFGLAHLPDFRYVLLATMAGVAYGWVYWRTERITASAVAHAAVDWTWRVAFRR
jgi:membrane protease YdiL (CAAX protease family)